MDPLIVTLPSPLLGPAVWQPVVEVLTRRGWQVTTAAHASVAPVNSPDVLREFLGAVPLDRAVVLVAHSNAGLYVPALVQQRTVVASVFVDAGLPESDWVPVAAPGLVEFLRPLADSSGLLPGWTNWWDESDLEGLFPSALTRARVEDEQRRLPLTYFQETLPVPVGWADCPGAYLAFGDTYAVEREAPRARGWPVTTLPGEHLHMLIAPEQVASAIEDLLKVVL